MLIPYRLAYSVKINYLQPQFNKYLIQFRYIYISSTSTNKDCTLVKKLLELKYSENEKYPLNLL